MQIFKELGRVTAVIGAQWGDEGKGKIIDELTPHFDILARACGGANAGHTIVVAGKKHVFHLLPAGSIHEGKTLILGSGMAIHLPTLLEEIRTLENAGINVLSRLSLSQEAHIVLQYHKEIDGLMEERRRTHSGESVGTTRRGIGPTYADKAYRTGLRMQDLRRGGDWKSIFEQHARKVHTMFGIAVSIEQELSHLEEAADLLGSCIEDTVNVLHEAHAHGQRILIEGAQGTLLDLDHGTYPFVTSSATTSAGALQGLGLPPRVLTGCIGVVKAYCTRVGGGPFPTEASEEDSARLRARGSEFGATTGRPRRCGWLSLSDLARATATNGFTHLNLTKLDVLDEEETIPVFFQPANEQTPARRPVRRSSKSEGGSFSGGGSRPEMLPGWKAPTKGMTSFDDLPENAKNYVRTIEERTGVPTSFIGTGPGREEMIVR